MTERPVGVTIAAVLYSFGGIILLVSVAKSVTTVELRSVVPGESSLLTDLGFQGVIALAAGVGIWSRKKWGWWFATFYLCYSASLGFDLLLSPVLGRQQQVLLDYRGAIMRVVISLALLSYFFRENVEQFFELAATTRWRRLGILLVCAIAASLALAGISTLVGRSATV
jgi:hypothetical protein